MEDNVNEKLMSANEQFDESKIAEILIRSIMEPFVSRLINEGFPLLSLLIFPGVKYEPVEISRPKHRFKKVFRDWYIVCDDLRLQKQQSMDLSFSI